MRHFFFALLAISFLTSCNNVEALKKETETIHDEAMKEMAEMNRTARAIKDFLVSASMTPEQSAQYVEVLTAMGKAENDMMSWMANYKEPVGKSADEATQYLTEQKKLIEANYADIKAATAAGKKILGQ